jgi:asparagine synthase (glutamine-hydrolysing)
VSGIVGLFNLDGRPVERALLHRLAGRLAHRGPDAEGVWVDDEAGLGCRLLRVTPESRAETQPLVDLDGTALVFDGRLDNREELLSRLGTVAGVDGRSPDPALVLAAYRLFGEDLAAHLAGDFALGLMDSRHRRLLLARDALGVRPLYWTRVARTFVFASEIKALLAHPAVHARPNDDYLANMLLDGAPDGSGATLFADVFALPPAHTAMVSRERFTVRRYWDFDVTRQLRLVSVEEYASAFRDHFDRAVRRRLRSAHPVAVSVSGGLDSSSILCCALGLARRDAALPPIAGVSFTFPDGSSADEKRFLVEIERQYVARIRRVPSAGAGVLADAGHTVWHTEMPLLDEQGSTNAAVYRAARGLGARTLLGGQWGDQILCSGGYLVDLALSGRLAEVRRHLAEIPRWFTDAEPRQFRRAFAVGFLKEVTPVAWHPVLRRFRRPPARPWYTLAVKQRARWTTLKRVWRGPRIGSAHARSVYEEARSSYHVRCMEWENKIGASHGLDLAFPFLDRDLLAFVMAVPDGLHARGGVPKAILRDAMGSDLPPAITERRWKADFSDVVNEGVRREMPALHDFFATTEMAARHGYVDAEVLRAQLARLARRLEGADCEIAWSVSDLVGLETWLRVFFGQTRQAADVPGDGTLTASVPGATS